MEMLDLPTLVNASKRLPFTPKWIERDSSRAEFVAALEIDEQIVEGLEIRGSAILSMPNRGVTINLLFHPAGAKCVPLSRIEWNPLRPHTNPFSSQFPDISGLQFRATHIHRFEDNWHLDHQQMREKNLPFARPIEPNPNSFEDLLVFVKDSLRIEGIRAIEPPNWREGSLFEEGFK